MKSKKNKNLRRKTRKYRKRKQKGGGISTAYVINLDSSSARWERIQNDFKDTSINLERVSAVQDSNSNMGCSLSLIKVIQLAKDNNLKSVLIFEDDNKPLENFDIHWKTIKTWLDNNSDKWDVFNGGPRFNDWGTYNESTEIVDTSKYDNNIKLFITLDNSVNLFTVNSSILSTNWMYINSSVYDKILSWSFEKNDYIDKYLNNINEFKVLISIPLLGLQYQPTETNSRSTNIDKNFSVIDNAILRIYDNISKKIQKGGSEEKNKLYLTLMGGLANRIFQIYAGLGFAEKWNMDLYINAKIMYDNNHIKKDKSIEEIKQIFPSLNWVDSIDTKLDTVYDPEEFIYHDLPSPNKSVILHGIFQSEKYFPKNKVMLNFITPEPNILNNIDYNNLYFIHFRFGDYNNSPRHKLNLNKYYKYCINELNKLNNSITYLIVSDNINEAKEYINTNLLENIGNKNIIYDNNSSRLNTLYYMSKCSGSICPNSTFSWIGSYLINGKKVVYVPKPWLSDHNIDRNYDIYSEWMTVVNINNL